MVKRQNDPQNSTQNFKIEQHEPHLKSVGELWCSRRIAFPAPLVTPVVLLLNDNNIIYHGIV